MRRCSPSCRPLPGSSRHRADSNIGTTCRSSKPALFLSQHTETLTTSPGGDRHWQFSLIALIYVHTQADKTIAPTTLLNPIIDSVVAALLPDAITKRNTLGGVVMDAQISGAIEIDHYDDQAVVAIPITIKAAQ